MLHEHGLTDATAQSAIDRLNGNVTGPRLVTHTGAILSDGTPAPAAAPQPAPAPAPRPEQIVIRPSQPPVYSVRARVDIPGLLNRRGLLGTGVEVGVKEGKYSAAILEVWNGKLLVSVDPWLEAPADEYLDIANVSQDRQETFLATTRERLAPFGDRSDIWRMTGDEAAEQIEDGALDFVYLDARHDYESVKSDIAVWFPKVAPGGIISGHDYIDGDLPEGVFGVRSAVDEFFGPRGIPVGVATDSRPRSPRGSCPCPAGAPSASRPRGRPHGALRGTPREGTAGRSRQLPEASDDDRRSP